MSLAPRTKLAFSFAAAMTLVLAAFAAAVYVAVERALVEATDDKLRSRIESVEHGLAVDEEGRLGLAGSVTEEEPFSPLTEVVKLRDGAVVYHSDDLEDDTLARTGNRRRDLLEWKQPRPTFLASGHEVRLMAVRASSGGQVYEVWMAESLDPVRHEQRELARVLAVLLPAGLGLALAGGRWLAGRAIRPIEEALAASRRFTADASHELRTPLAALRTEVEVALRRERAPEEYRATLASVLEEAERLSALSARLLDLARADRPGGLPLEREAVALDALARDVCERLRPVASERGVALAGAAPGERAGATAVEDGFTVDGDRARLRELLENLVDNALKYTGAGGRVDVRLGRARGAIALEVADTGAGIAPEHLPHIFERFYRADPARGRGGAGLGLSIVRAIVDAHGGSVDVGSEVGKGTTFTVHLPAWRGET